MFLIIGTTPVKRKGTQTIRQHCPRCNDIRNFQEYEVRSFLSFFFLPIVPLGKKQSIYICPTCSYGMANDTIYEMPEPGEPAPPPDPANRVLLICPRCEGPMFAPRCEKRQLITCPHCTMEFKLKGIRGEVPDALVTDCI